MTWTLSCILPECRKQEILLDETRDFWKLKRKHFKLVGPPYGERNCWKTGVAKQAGQRRIFVELIFNHWRFLKLKFHKTWKFQVFNFFKNLEKLCGRFVQKFKKILIWALKNFQWKLDQSDKTNEIAFPVNNAHSTWKTRKGLSFSFYLPSFQLNMLFEIEENL